MLRNRICCVCPRGTQPPPLGLSKHSCLWDLDVPWVKGKQMSQSPSVAGAFHLLSQPCSLVPSPRGKSWCIPNLVPLNRADARVSPQHLPAFCSFVLVAAGLLQRDSSAYPCCSSPPCSPIYGSNRLPSALQCFPSCIASLPRDLNHSIVVPLAPSQQ